MPSIVAWTDNLLKIRLQQELQDSGSFGHGEVFEDVPNTPSDVESEDSDELRQQYDAAQRTINDQLTIMQRVMRRLHSRRRSSAHAAGSSPNAFPSSPSFSHAAYHGFPFAEHGTSPLHPTNFATPGSQTSQDIPNMQGDADSAEDVMPLRAMMVPQAHRRSRTHRVRRMAQSLKSPFVPQPHTRQSAIPMDLKEAIAFVFNIDMDPSEELVSLYGTHLTRGNLGCFEGSHWIGNEVMDAYCRFLQHEDIGSTKLFISPYLAEIVVQSKPKKLAKDSILNQYERFLYDMAIPYGQVIEVFLPLLIKNHWTIIVFDLYKLRIQLLDSLGGRKKTHMTGAQNNLAKVVLCLMAHKKGGGEFNLERFSFVMPDVPSQTNEHDCGVFAMKFMEHWSSGGLTKSIDPTQMSKYRLKILGNMLLSQHNAHRTMFQK